jgi:hypothetical protein
MACTPNAGITCVDRSKRTWSVRVTDTYLGIASLMVIVCAMVFWFRALKRVAIPENRLAYIIAAIISVLLGASALFSTPGWIGGIAASLGAAFSSLYLLTVAIGNQKLGEDAISVGATIPSFTAVDELGQKFDSQDLANTPALLKFFRGHW